VLSPPRGSEGSAQTNSMGCSPTVVIKGGEGEMGEGSSGEQMFPFQITAQRFFTPSRKSGRGSSETFSAKCIKWKGALV